MSKPLLISAHYRTRPYDAVKVEKTKQLEGEVYGTFDRECVLHLDIVLSTSDFTEVSHGAA
ncbi:hypothetical protein KUG47_11920 [Falsochrobactrum sp. TDYN1]|uniref:Uncharacterized protein n=1 Tax=Falsochrobactrum tianjinense TaxID=2706015 RepID=A0A949PSR8_9HYPH|nr:hypothetical protein [Falsochrobactrum sp. TDYN1]MBV2144200.1 hypothetical protein [Falsochrobactrum sp. TDYN1]